MYEKSIPAAIAFVLVAVIAGCSGREISSPAGKTGAVMEKDEALHLSVLYFSDPKTAVTVISGLIETSDWLTLSRYYDLSGSDIECQQSRFSRGIDSTAFEYLNLVRT